MCDPDPIFGACVETWAVIGMIGTIILVGSIVGTVVLGLIDAVRGR